MNTYYYILIKNPGPIHIEAVGFYCCSPRSQLANDQDLTPIFWVRSARSAASTHPFQCCSPRDLLDRADFVQHKRLLSCRIELLTVT